VFLAPEDPLAVALVGAIHSGDHTALAALLQQHDGLAAARVGEPAPGMSRTLLHVATDWPGHYPHVGATIGLLVAAGAEVNARFTGPHTETALHWAASSNDVEALDALLDAGADLEADGAVIGNGTALDDARAFGQRAAAARLIERGAQVQLDTAATLGLLDRLEVLYAAAVPPTAIDTTRAFWQACHGGQLAAAQYLHARGADLHWVPDWEPLTPLEAARRSGDQPLIDWLSTAGGSGQSRSTSPLR
jgi:uncharacterized protein